MEFLQPWHIVIVVVLLLVLFGAKRLPEMGKGLGEGWKGFKEGLSGNAGSSDAAAKTGETAHTVTPKAADELKPPSPPAA